MDRLEELGIVGAGGGGFPAAAKFQAKVPLVIVNGAECEPLLHKDGELLRYYSDAMFRGLATVMARVAAAEAVVAIKEKHSDIIAGISERLPAGVRVFPLTDTYPAGDEFILVHDITERVIPPGGLPLEVGAVVSNVETLVNIGLDRPVTHKYVTVSGAVRTPVTLRVPLGMGIGDVICAAGGASVADFGVLLGGVMMARRARGLDEPVTKTTGGIIVLPSSHKLLQKHSAKWAHVQRIGRSACDQCRFCTELCPRYLLGHPIQPHRVMQGLGFSHPGDLLAGSSLACCECNLCTMYACPEDLDPKAVCLESKRAAKARRFGFPAWRQDTMPHPLAASRRVPTRRLISRLGLADFNDVGPLDARQLSPPRVIIPLQQHAGVPAVPVVNIGARVRAGDLLAVPPAGKLGARINASINGVVTEINDAIVVQA